MAPKEQLQFLANYLVFDFRHLLFYLKALFLLKLYFTKVTNRVADYAYQFFSDDQPRHKFIYS